MSNEGELRVIVVGGMIEAVLRPGPRRAHVARRLVRGGGVFDAELSARWGAFVTCSPQFSEWWRPRASEGPPVALFSLGALII